MAGVRNRQAPARIWSLRPSWTIVDADPDGELALNPIHALLSAPVPCGVLVQADAAAALRSLAGPLGATAACAYLDPPYNTGRARPGYHDRKPHDAWLADLEAVIVATRALLAPHGVLFVQVDDPVQAHVQLLLDRVFGPGARMATIVVKMSELSGLKMSSTERHLPRTKEFVFAYGNSPAARFRPLTSVKPGIERYRRYYNHFIDNPGDPVERWRVRRIREHLLDTIGRATDDDIDQFRQNEAHRVIYRTNNRLLAGLTFASETAEVISPTGVRYIWWQGREMLILADRLRQPLSDIWTDISTINLGREGGVAFRGSKKPEALLRRIIELTTTRGDLVIDPYAGSGTTAAVAHKLERRWLTVEASATNAALARERLTRVVEGRDRAGISADLEWRGGGSFDFVSPASETAS